MDLYKEVILEIDSDNEQLQHELQQLVNVASTAANIAMYKPNVKKELEDDPEDFLREIIEGHIAHSIKRFTDISQAQAEKYESEYKRLKEWLEDAPVHFGIPHLHDPHELSEQAISEHVEIMLEARSIFFDFMFGKDRDKEQNKT